MVTDHDHGLVICWTGVWFLRGNGGVVANVLMLGERGNVGVSSS